MFQKGHGRVNFVAIKTSKGYYAAYVAGQDVWTDDPLKARLMEAEHIAHEYYARSITRSKNLNTTLPKAYEIAKVKIAVGMDRNS